jgi:hypothetical protein
MVAIHLCTFGTLPEYALLLTELQREAAASEYFATITTYTQENLPATTDEWRFIRENHRGYGYWIWKSILLEDMMEKIPEGDILIYADAGCGIRSTPEAKRRMQLWIDLATQHPSHRVGFQLRHMAYVWTKMDIFQEFQSDMDPTVTNTGQHMGGIQIYQNLPANREFIRQYRSILARHNYRLVDDSPSLVSNFPGFKENRHDQAILSILYKRLGCATIQSHCDDADSPIKVHCRRANT